MRCRPFLSIVVLLLLIGGCSSADSTASQDVTAPDELVALVDEWYAALDRGDGSVLDLYVSDGYHLYGDQRFEYDEIEAHLTAGSVEHEWLTEPLLVAEDADGRYVVVRAALDQPGRGTHVGARLGGHDRALGVAATAFAAGGTGLLGPTGRAARNVRLGHVFSDATRWRRRQVAG